MARIQYQPASRRKGFQPQELSTAGISRMREESNRIIQGMENNRQAEKEQRDREFQALRDDAAYTERITKENRATEVQNLKNEAAQKLSNFKVAQEQAAIDSRATQDIFNSLAGFSQTLAKTAAERTAQMIKDQTTEGSLAEASIFADKLTLAPTPALQEYQEAQGARAKGGVALHSAITENAVQNNEDPAETIRNYASNPALSSIAQESNDNKAAFLNYKIFVERLLKSNDKIFTLPDGTNFSGLEARSDRTKMQIVQNEARRRIFSEMNIVEPKKFANAIGKMEEYNQSLGDSAANQGFKRDQELIERRAQDLESSGTTENITLAFVDRKAAFGLAAAHDGVQKLIANPDIPAEAIDKLDLLGDGRRYSEVWPRRWSDGMAERENLIVKRQNDAERFAKAEERQWVVNNIDNIREAYRLNPKQAATLIQQRYHSKGMTIPPLIKEVQTAAFKETREEAEQALQTRIKFGTLDMQYVNRIQDPTIRKAAAEALQAQEQAKYGPEALGIKKGFRATARKLTKINPNEGNDSPQTFLVQARLEREYLKALETTQDPLKANEIVNQLVDAGNTGDKNSPFYFETGANNRLVFPSIESSDVDRAKMNASIDKKMLEYGTATVDQAYSLATADEMDKTYQTAQTPGARVVYPAGVMRFADKYGFKYAEVYNAQRQANNATATNKKPLLSPNPTTDFIDNQRPDIRKLLMSNNYGQVNRGLATATGNLNNNLRPNMGGDSMRERTALDVLGKYESDSVGGYDAVNQGGADGGNTVLGYSGPFSQMSQHSGRKLTDLTIGEIMELQRDPGSSMSMDQWIKSGKLHAVGRYQFIGSTFANVVNKMGIDSNTRFTPEVQDAMALWLLRNSKNGIGQWVGPANYATAQERAAVNAVR